MVLGLLRWHVLRLLLQVLLRLLGRGVPLLWDLLLLLSVRAMGHLRESPLALHAKKGPSQTLPLENFRDKIQERSKNNKGGGHATQ